MKNLILIALLFVTSCASFASTPKKVLMVVNEGFQVDEYFVPKNLFEKAGFEVKTASRYGGLVNPGRRYQARHNPIQTDMNFEEINLSDFDAITFTGGGGAWSDYFPNKTLHHVLINASKKEGMIVGLICAATGILATANNLNGATPQFKGRHVTGYGEVAGLLALQGQINYDAGDLNKPYVVVDHNLITGRDPSSSKLFGEAIVEKLQL